MAKDKVAIVFGLILVFLTASSVINLKLVKADNPSNITINFDGSTNPISAPILRVGNKYTLTDDFDGYLTIEASDIVLDGASHIVKGLEGENIVNTENPSIEEVTAIYDLTNVTIKNFDIRGEFDLVRFGIKLRHTSNFSIINNSISNVYIAIELGGSGNIVTGNNITNTQHVAIRAGENSVIIGNKITKSGIAIAMTSNSSVISNLIENNDCGISSYTYGTPLFPYETPPSGNIVYGNNFVNNSYNVLNSGSEGAYIGKIANWDNGSIGNYWNDYYGTDADGDGVGDIPYVIDENNQDNYPLMAPFEALPSPEPQSIGAFPTMLILASLVIVAVVGVSLFVYFKKRKRQTDRQ
jgi:hypothetical protein